MSSSVAPTLPSRLAAACNCAYSISSKDGVYSPPAIYDAAVNWSSPPKAFSASKSNQPTGPRINACLIGLNQDGIVVAFRGTLPPAWTVASVEDWWQDIVGSSPMAAPPFSGKVHSGFWHALKTLWDGVSQEITTLKKANPGAPVFVTGHSKGGPLASLGAGRLSLECDIHADQVSTFASPHPGDATFVANYPRLSVVRFENYLDLVPFLPPTEAFFKIFSPISNTWLGKEFCKRLPKVCAALENASKWDYAPLGTLNYVTSDGHVVGDKAPAADLEWRLVQILGAIFGFGNVEAKLIDLIHHQASTISHSGFSRIGAAHCIACKADLPGQFCAGGYMTGAGGNPICTV